MHDRHFDFHTFFSGHSPPTKSPSCHVGLVMRPLLAGWQFALPQEVLGCPKWIQHHKKHVRDCQWTSAREFDLSLEPKWLSGLAPSCPETGTPFCEKCHFCVFGPSESGFQLFRMHWRARVFLVKSIRTGFREKNQLSRGVDQARARHDP